MDYLHYLECAVTLASGWDAASVCPVPLQMLYKCLTLCCISLVVLRVQNLFLVR